MPQHALESTRDLSDAAELVQETKKSSVGKTEGDSNATVDRRGKNAAIQMVQAPVRAMVLVLLEMDVPIPWEVIR